MFSLLIVLPVGRLRPVGLELLRPWVPAALALEFVADPVVPLSKRALPDSYPLQSTCPSQRLTPVGPRQQLHLGVQVDRSGLKQLGVRLLVRVPVRGPIRARAPRLLRWRVTARFFFFSLPEREVPPLRRDSIVAESVRFCCETRYSIYCHGSSTSSCDSSQKFGGRDPLCRFDRS